jgi:hypothetical protein
MSLFQFSELNKKYHMSLENQELAINHLKQNFGECHIELINMFIRKSKYEYLKAIENKEKGIYYMCDMIKENITTKNRFNEIMMNIKSCIDINDIYK